MLDFWTGHPHDAPVQRALTLRPVAGGPHASHPQTKGWTVFGKSTPGATLVVANPCNTHLAHCQ